MAKDVSAHDATTDLSAQFTEGTCSRVVVTLKWTGIAGSSAAAVYRLRHSNFNSTDADLIPELSLGFVVPNGSGEKTLFAANPANFLEHTFNSGIVSAGTLDISTKVLFDV